MPTLAEILDHLLVLAASGPTPGERTVTAVTADSRAVVPGALFVAVTGGRADGHRYLVDAAAHGAAAALGMRAPGDLAADGIGLPPGFFYAQVADSRAALALAAAAFHGFPSHNLAVIGVTGTDGKTTSASLLESILVAATHSGDAPEGRVGVVTTVGARIRGAAGDTGLHVTTPDAPDIQRYLAAMRDAGCRFAVVESTSHGLDQQRVGAVEFDIAAVTNITHEHLDYHGTRDAYVVAKARLFRALYASPAKPGIPRCAVLNADDVGSYSALLAAMADEAATRGMPPVPVRAYGLAQPDCALPDVSAAEVAYRPDRTAFTLRWWGGQFDIETRLIGDFNVSNVLAAATVALALGIPPETVRAGIAAFPGVLGRMERMDRGQPFLAIVDFAHSPASLERALQTLRPLAAADDEGAPGRLIAVFGSAGLRDRAKRRWMGQVSGRLADFTVITAEDPRTEDLDEINREIESGVREFAGPDRCAVVPDRAAAIQLAVDMARPGDIVAAFGKGHERSMCFGETEFPWSDQQAMLDALDRRMARK